MQLPTIAPDKLGHFVYGQLVSCLGFALSWAGTAAFDHPLHSMSWLSGIFAAASVGVVKEISDYVVDQRWKQKGLPQLHGVEWGDFFATLLGGCVPMFSIWLGSVALP